METKSFEGVELKTESEGTFTALVASFNRPDKAGDVIRPGAFLDTLAQWRASGSKLPVIFSHAWKDPQQFIGECDPSDLHETAMGFEASGRLFLDEPNGQKIWRELRRKTLKEWSFAFVITKSKELARGTREILKLDLLEIGPCLSGVGTSATLAVKAEDLSAAIQARLAKHRQAVRVDHVAPLEAQLVGAQRRWRLARAEQDLANRRTA
jgi:HK97 family phage prohead protease